MKKTSSADYRGFTGVRLKAQKDAVDALYDTITTTCKASTTLVLGSFELLTTNDARMFDIWQVDAIEVTYSPDLQRITTARYWLRDSVSNLGVLAAAEEFLGHYSATKGDLESEHAQRFRSILAHPDAGDAQSLLYYITWAAAQSEVSAVALAPLLTATPDGYYNPAFSQQLREVCYDMSDDARLEQQRRFALGAKLGPRTVFELLLPGYDVDVRASWSLRKLVAATPIAFDRWRHDNTELFSMLLAPPLDLSLTPSETTSPPLSQWLFDDGISLIVEETHDGLRFVRAATEEQVDPTNEWLEDSQRYRDTSGCDSKSYNLLETYCRLSEQLRSHGFAAYNDAILRVEPPVTASELLVRLDDGDLALPLSKAMQSVDMRQSLTAATVAQAPTLSREEDDKELVDISSGTLVVPTDNAANMPEEVLDAHWDEVLTSAMEHLRDREQRVASEAAGSE